MALVRYNSVFVPLCSPNTCKDVFNPNVTTFQSNCAEGLHFSAFHCNMTSLNEPIGLFNYRLKINQSNTTPPDKVKVRVVVVEVGYIELGVGLICNLYLHIY